MLNYIYIYSSTTIFLGKKKSFIKFFPFLILIIIKLSWVSTFEGDSEMYL